MTKADQNTLSKFKDTSAPAQVSGYKTKYNVTDLDIKRAVQIGIAKTEHGHIFVRKSGYAPKAAQKCNSLKAVEVIEKVKEGLGFSHEIAAALGRNKESVRQQLYRAFRGGLVQRQELRGCRVFRYYI